MRQLWVWPLKEGVARKLGRRKPAQQEQPDSAAAGGLLAEPGQERARGKSEHEAKEEVASFEKKVESQQLVVKYLLNQGKSEQEAKEEASNF